MPQDKNIRVRHIFLDSLFRNKRLTIDELLEAVNSELRIKALSEVSLRTIKNDLNIFETDYGADFEPDAKFGRKRLYYYADSNFCAFRTRELSNDEKNIINSSIAIMDQIEGLPGSFDYENIKMSLCEIVNYSPQTKPIVYYETNPYLKGLEKWWKTLYEAINNKSVLTIRYINFIEPQFVFVVSPYALKEYAQRWYLICRNHENQGLLYNLALDRIEDVIINKKSVFIENTFDINEYYERAYGITVRNEDKPKKIVFIVSKPTANYFITKPIHPNAIQKRLNDGSLQVTLTVIVNYELEHMLLKYADSIKIIEPPELIDNHKQMLKAALLKYE